METRWRTPRSGSAVTTNGEESAEAVVARKFRNGNGAKGRTGNQL
ncbi:hypothetical protein [[Eubacterium] hominis]